MQERGSRKPENGSSALAGPLTQGKPLEIKFKAPCCCPEAAASEGLLTACNRERGRKLLKKFLIKLGVSMVVMVVVLLMRSTTTPDQILFIELSLTKGNRRLRFSHLLFSLPSLIQTEPSQIILGIAPNCKTQLLTKSMAFNI